MRGSLIFLKRSERGGGVVLSGIGEGFFFVRVFLEVPGLGMVTGLGKRSYELLTLTVQFERKPVAAIFLFSLSCSCSCSCKISFFRGFFWVGDIFMLCYVI